MKQWLFHCFRGTVTACDLVALLVMAILVSQRRETDLNGSNGSTADVAGLASSPDSVTNKSSNKYLARATGGGGGGGDDDDDAAAAAAAAAIAITA
ncbi:hypothetical protein SAMD00023353_0401420 [Rosellinia necatrix]|uniref:Uncharacterized protein n=1 Tax=Rosellinia necatrix TaxID=77044 RepID=A0A1S8A5D7_ROSNE|nr:hypothetical protein SAMD00023353_0401420 [Rosellinia necatrix]